MRREIDTFFDISAFAYAHRGLWGGNIPENSLAAFSAASAAGVGAELDVRATLDERLVVFHDATLQRMCGRPERVDQLTFRDIRMLTLPDGSPIPTLEEALEAMAGLPTLVEIKIDPPVEGTSRNRAAVDAVIGTLKFSSAPAAVMSFDEPALWKLTGPLGITDHRAAGLLIDALETLGPDEIAAKAGRAREMGCAYLCPHHTSLAAAGHGLPLVTWTVRTQPELKRARKHAAAPIFEGLAPSEVTGLANSSQTPI